MQIRDLAFTHPHARSLDEQVQAEYTLRYGGPDETPLEPEMLAPPRGAFFVGYVDQQPVAMGGWRFREDVPGLGAGPVAEIKRMYVVPRLRRQGLARQVLGHLESTARQAGARTMVLETGTEQPEAIALYRAAGYRPVDGFGHYRWSPLSRHFGKPL